MQDVRARSGAQAAATRLAALALCFMLTATQGCRGGDREVVFPTEDGGLGEGDAGVSGDASTPRDAMPPDDEDPGAPGNAGENRRPVAHSLALELDEDTSVSKDLSGSDPDGDVLSFELVDMTAHGDLTLDADSGEVRYVPDPDFNGADGFRFRVNDGSADSAAAWVEIEVSPVNDAPEAHSSSVDTDEDTAVEFTLQVSEADGDGVAYEIVDAPAHGTLTIVDAPDAVYTPAGNYSGVDSFRFRVDDGSAESRLATVTIAVAEINDPPIVHSDWLRVVEGGTAMQLVNGSTSLLANDSDLEADALSLSTTPRATPAHGTVTLNANGTFSYAHDGGDAASDSFAYEVCDDGTPSYCVTATVAVTITAESDPPTMTANDAPTAVDDTLTVAEGGTAVRLAAGTDSVLDNDADANDDALTATIEIYVTNGTLTLNANGTFSYLHDGSDTTSDSFAYEVCDDAAPRLCDRGTVTIVVTPVNDEPPPSGEGDGDGDAGAD